MNQKTSDVVRRPDAGDLVDRVTHRHDVDELTWVASGACELVVDDRRWRIDTETALLIPAGVEHVVVPRPDSLVFPLLLDERAAPGDDGRRRGHTSAGDAGVGPTLIRRSPALDACARVMLQPGLATAESVASARTTLRALVASSLRADDDAPVLPVDARARQVAELLLEHPATPFDLEEWARVVHTSGKTLQRYFRRDTGMSFPEWRANARLRLARERLERGESVAAVAMAVGYGSPSAFSTAFRRRYDATPGALRPARRDQRAL